MTDSQAQYQTSEIDLHELITTLWRNRLLISAIASVFGIAGIVYAFLAPQVWIAKAIVVAPLSEQLEQLQLRLDHLVALTSITSSKDVEFFKNFSKEEIFISFVQEFESFDNKSEFLLKNGYVHQEGTKGGDAMHRSLVEMAKIITANQKTKDDEFMTLSFGSNNAQEAQKMLKEYLDFIQIKESKTKNKLLAEKIANLHNSLTLAYQVEEGETLNRLQEEITRTDFALRISRTAGLEAPVENLNNQDIFTIDLGAKALNEKLNILKEIKNPVLINPKLADMRLQLDSLKVVPRDNVRFTSYHFLQSPSKPLHRDKPKRPLVIVLATLAGGMLGLMVVLLRVSLRSGNSKKD